MNRKNPKCCCAQCMDYIDIKTKGSPTYNASTMQFEWSDTAWNTPSAVSYVVGYEPPTGAENTIPANTTVKMLVTIPCSNYQFGLGIAKTSNSTNISDTVKGVRVKVGKFLQAWQNVPYATSSEIAGWASGSAGAAWTIHAGHCVEYSGRYAFGEMNLSFGEYDAFGSAYGTVVMLGDSLQNGVDGTTLYNNPDDGTYDIPTDHLKKCIGRIPSFPAGSRTIPITIETNSDEVEIYNCYMWHGSQHAFKQDPVEQNLLRDVYVINNAPTSTLSNVNTPTTVGPVTYPSQDGSGSTLDIELTLDHSYRIGSHNWKTYRDQYMPHRLKVLDGLDGRIGGGIFHPWEVSNTAPEATASELTELEDIKDFYLDWGNFTHDAVLEDPNIYYYLEPEAPTQLSFSITPSACSINSINKGNWDTTSSHVETQPISMGLMHNVSGSWGTLAVNYDCATGWYVSLIGIENGFRQGSSNTDWIPYGDTKRTQRLAEFIRDCDVPSLGLPSVLWPMERERSTTALTSEAMTQATDNVPNYLATTVLTKSNIHNSYAFSTSWTQKRIDTFIDFGLTSATSSYAQNCNWFQNNMFGVTSPWTQGAAIDYWGVRRTSTKGLPALKNGSLAVSSASLGGVSYSAVSQCEFFQGDVTSAPLSNYSQHKVISIGTSCGVGSANKRYTNNRNLLSMKNGDTEIFKIGFADELYNFPDLDVILSSGTVYSFDATDLYETMANSKHQSIGPASVTLTNGNDTISLQVRH